MTKLQALFHFTFTLLPHGKSAIPGGMTLFVVVVGD